MGLLITRHLLRNLQEVMWDSAPQQVGKFSFRTSLGGVLLSVFFLSDFIPSHGSDHPYSLTAPAQIFPNPSQV